MGVRDAVPQLGVEIRVGVHTGELEMTREKTAGNAVPIGARVAGIARPGEVLVSRTTKDLNPGSGIQFTDRGSHTLKGIPRQWQLFAAMWGGLTLAARLLLRFNEGVVFKKFH